MAKDPAVALRTTVSPERLTGWIERFAGRHGEPEISAGPDALVLHSPDGATARLVNLWEPWPGSGTAEFVEHVSRVRTIGLLLVRKGADAVAVARGTELVVHRVSTHYVQGRTKAGGWSQQRYARRRQNQADRAFQKASDNAFEVLTARLDELEALVTGGDKAALASVLADPRLAGLAALPARHPVLDVPDARLTVLADAAVRARAVPIELNQQATAQPGPDSAS